MDNKKNKQTLRTNSASVIIPLLVFLFPVCLRIATPAEQPGGSQPRSLPAGPCQRRSGRSVQRGGGQDTCQVQRRSFGRWERPLRWWASLYPPTFRLLSSLPSNIQSCDITILLALVMCVQRLIYLTCIPFFFFNSLIPVGRSCAVLLQESSYVMQRCCKWRATSSPCYVQVGKMC